MAVLESLHKLGVAQGLHPELRRQAVVEPPHFALVQEAQRVVVRLHEIDPGLIVEPILRGRVELLLCCGYV